MAVHRRARDEIRPIEQPLRSLQVPDPPVPSGVLQGPELPAREEQQHHDQRPRQVHPGQRQAIPGRDSRGVVYDLNPHQFPSLDEGEHLKASPLRMIEDGTPAFNGRCRRMFDVRIPCLAAADVRTRAAHHEARGSIAACASTEGRLGGIFGPRRFTKPCPVQVTLRMPEEVDSDVQR
jgi:hypothetical protein